MSATLYPLLLAGLYAVFGFGPAPIGLFQAGLGGALAWVAYGIARPSGAVVALGSALAVALHPGLLVYSASINSLAFDALLLALLAFQFIRLRTGITQLRVAGLAATCAVMTVERPILLCAVVVGLIGLGIALPRREVLHTAAICLLAVVLAASPMIIRNKVVLGEFVFSPTAGEILWRGNNPNASGGGVTLDGRSIVDASPEIREAVWGRSELEQDQVFRGAAMKYVSEEPHAAAVGVLKKFLHFWTFSPAHGSLYPAVWMTAYLAYYMIVMLLAVMGLKHALQVRLDWWVFVIVSVPIAVSLVQALFYVDGRHRWQVEPLLLVLAALGASRLAGWASRVRRGRVVVGGA